MTQYGGSAAALLRKIQIETKRLNDKIFLRRIRVASADGKSNSHQLRVCDNYHQLVFMLFIIKFKYVYFLFIDFYRSIVGF